jgi:Mor family transcriptional regulator
VSEFIDDMRASIEKSLHRLGVSTDVAALVSSEIAIDIAHRWQGNEAYIGARDLKRMRLAEDVRRRFNGANAREVARELRIGRATVYRLLKTAGR